MRLPTHRLDADISHVFRQLAEKSQDIFWIKDAHCQCFDYVSPAFETIWGVGCEALLADPAVWYGAIYEEDLPALKAVNERLLQAKGGGGPVVTRYRMVHHKEGGTHTLEDTVFPLLSDKNELMGFAGITKDVTALSQRIAEFDEATYFFKLFAEKMRAVFWVRDDSCNKQIYLSPGYEKIWKRSRRNLYENPNSWLETIYAEDREMASNAMRFRVLDEEGYGVHYENRYRITIPDGSLRWVKDISFPIQDEAGNFIGFAGIAEDITKEVEYEKELHAAKERAEIANRIKSDFLAMVSHELRTPLNAILGMSQILQKKEISPEVRENIDVIREAGSNLLSLVSDILDFARLEVGKLHFVHEPFYLPDVFKRAVIAMEYLAEEKGLTLNFSMEPNLQGHVMGDPNRVRQVLTNLITNAIKFTEAGHIKVHLKSGIKAQNKAGFDIIVEDTGIGIPEDKLDFIFDKFSQVDSIYQRKHGGVGLGLAITKELVSVMGGTIRVMSQLGKGSQFHVTLSLDLQTQKEQQDTAWREAMLQSAGLTQFDLRILLVEDNRLNQRIARMMLEDFGCRVDILNSGEEVMAKLNELSSYDLIFMDVGLPDMSGFEITARLRKERSLMSLPIVAMTAHVLESDQAQAFAAGMDKIVAKPIGYDEIRSVLEWVKEVH